MNMVANAKVQHIEYVLSEIQNQIRYAEQMADTNARLFCLTGIYNDLEDIREKISIRNALRERNV